MLRIALKSRIHRTFVTATEPDYIGNIYINQDLMERVGMWKYEQVLTCDVDRHNKFVEYLDGSDKLVEVL